MSTLIEKKNEKRKKIIESAFNLFTEKNFNTTAIDDIVRKAGVAKGTFYLYFKDKYDLLNQIVIFRSAELMNKAMDYVEQNCGENACLKDKLLMLMVYIEDYLVAHKEFTAFVEKKFSSCFRVITNDSTGEYSELKEKLTAPLIAEGFTPDEAWKKIYIITDMVGSVCCDAILLGSPFTMDELKQELNDSVLKLVRKDD